MNFLGTSTFPEFPNGVTVFIILVKEIFCLSNRKAAYLLPLLGIGKDISYKTVERLYSDPLVIMILNNLFMNPLKRKGVASVDASGDGTGYSLTVTKHYRSLKERNCETVKEGKFVYSFALMDLATRMYVEHAVSKNGCVSQGPRDDKEYAH